GGDLDANSHKIINLTDPTNDQDAATLKKVVDLFKETEYIGSSNSFRVHASIAGAYDNSTYAVGVGHMIRSKGVNAAILFVLSGVPLTKKIDGTTYFLYLKAVHYGIYNANTSNYVDRVRTYGLTYTSYSSIIDDGTNRTTAQERTINVSPAVKISVYNNVQTYVNITSNTFDGIRLSFFQYELYYDL
ncbi:MAG: hypothetical protein ACTSYF_03410, partial [Promethearchaeota archaeon]